MHDHATGAVGSVHADISATVAANRLGAEWGTGGPRGCRARTRGHQGGRGWSPGAARGARLGAHLFRARLVDRIVLRR